MVLLDRLADLLGWLAFRVFPYREHVVRENLTKAFPDLDEAGLRQLMRAYYRGFAQMLVELLKGASLIGVNLRQFGEADPQRADANREKVFALAVRGLLRPVVAQSFPLERFAEAMAAAAGGHGAGRIVIAVRSPSG